jgi:hypothetical protein
MQLTPESLEYITRMAAAAFTPHEIAIVLQVDGAVFCAAADDCDHEVAKAYNRGFLTRQLELRERIFQDAKNGSSPAQTIAARIMENCIVKSKFK